jgi:small subunit ribosomal protein S21
MEFNSNTKFKGSTVYVKNENVEQALRKFKKKIQEFGLLQELRDREFFEKPTTERKRRKGAARARWRKHLQSQKLPKKLF